MRNNLGDFFYLLLLGLFFLGHYLYQWLNRERKAGASTDAPDAAGRPETRRPVILVNPEDFPALQIPHRESDAAHHRAHPGDPHEPRQRRPSRPAPSTLAKVPRRYSREALFGTQRQIQNAVVVSVILGPCRADQPYDQGGHQ